MVLGSTVSTAAVNDPTGGAAVVASTSPVARADEQRLPVHAALAPLLPGGGLRRGSVVAVEGVGSTSLLLALLARPSDAGSWVAVVGLPHLGLAAAADFGLVLSRLALVADPAPASWSTGVAALVDAFDLVVAVPRHARPSDARRLAARARERGAVLLLAGDRSRWGEGPDLILRVDESTWSGLGRGHGHLTGRRVRVTARGRREASRPRQASLWLVDDDGQVTEAPAADRVVPLRGSDESPTITGRVAVPTTGRLDRRSAS
jgi:hypothetical protein